MNNLDPSEAKDQKLTVQPQLKSTLAKQGTPASKYF